MFTLRFETDTRSTESGDVTMVVSSKFYRTRYGNEVATVTLDDDTSCIIDGQLGGWDRCYVMNATGATIEKIRRPLPGVASKDGNPNVIHQ